MATKSDEGLAVKQARGEVAAVVAALETLRLRLLMTREDLPASPVTLDLDDLMEVDALAETRMVIECVVRDNIDLAIRDLRALSHGTETEEK